MQKFSRGFLSGVGATVVLVISAARGAAVLAQVAGSNASHFGDEGLIDAILATPNQVTPVLQDNQFATAPGLEQAARTPQFTFNGLVPLFYNSNPEFLSSGGSQSFDASPVVRLGWASQLFDTPLRISGAASLEWERYPNANDASLDYFRSSARIQYINLGDDQGFSPFLSYVPRMDFEPTFGLNFATRQDLNLGVDKVFNFDGAFNRVPVSANSASATVWSFGFSVGGQQRFRDPPPQSQAIFFNPSASWVISPQWNASLSTSFTRRWFDEFGGISPKDLTLDPVGVLEYVIPSSWIGGETAARALGNPAVDFLVLYEKNWSTVSSLAYRQWLAGLVFKAGWRF
jgi:hypothetical protein